ncbi:hypothetical protein BpHYR1_018197 [Brachionus plicatilis]|uniref:Uncharacterized protein n=1 Tax=Brachionus plicatilis TaxID=10195 RepID=A0A3M7P4M3_BRAPC|nr:hypothetical protein BpHYR1_018197 [Brachionus plicatilis]
MGLKFYQFHKLIRFCKRKGLRKLTPELDFDFRIAVTLFVIDAALIFSIILCVSGSNDHIFMLIKTNYYRIKKGDHSNCENYRGISLRGFKEIKRFGTRSGIFSAEWQDTTRNKGKWKRANTCIVYEPTDSIYVEN